MGLRIVLYKIVLFNVNMLTFFLKCNGICAKTCERKPNIKKSISYQLGKGTHFMMVLSNTVLLLRTIDFFDCLFWYIQL